MGTGVPTRAMFADPLEAVGKGLRPQGLSDIATPTISEDEARGEEVATIVVEERRSDRLSRSRGLPTLPTSAAAILPLRELDEGGSGEPEPEPEGNGGVVD